MINLFDGKYAFLSNFYEVPLWFGGIRYPHSEGAFQAQKTLDENHRKLIATMTPGQSKREGRRVALRPDWEAVKENVMYRVCWAKFTQNPELAKLLLETGNEELVEGNTWGDRTWGKVNGEGLNLLGQILMRIRAEIRELYEAEGRTVENIIEWIRQYFKDNGTDATKAVIGISGGKDSSIVAALCVKALGKDRIVGVLMPQGEQHDIDCSRNLVNFLGIPSVTINIGDTVNTLQNEIKNANVDLTEQAVINTPARIRMTTLYAVSACVGGRVANTCNKSEDYVGYSTKFGDSAGDFSPLSDLTVTEVLKIGDILGLPYELVHKTPIDGLCGKTDEENLGFSYKILDEYINNPEILAENPELKNKIDQMHRRNLHKLNPMPIFKK